MSSSICVLICIHVPTVSMKNKIDYRLYLRFSLTCSLAQINVVISSEHSM